MSKSTKQTHSLELIVARFRVKFYVDHTIGCSKDETLFDCCKYRRADEADSSAPVTVALNPNTVISNSLIVFQSSITHSQACCDDL